MVTSSPFSGCGNSMSFRILNKKILNYFSALERMDVDLYVKVLLPLTEEAYSSPFILKYHSTEHISYNKNEPWTARDLKLYVEDKYHLPSSEFNIELYLPENDVNFKDMTDFTVDYVMEKINNRLIPDYQILDAFYNKEVFLLFFIPAQTTCDEDDNYVVGTAAQMCEF